MTTHKLVGQLLAQMPNTQGGNTATSFLTRNYRGRCEVRSNRGTTVAVLSSVKDAFSVACTAIRLDFDIGSVVVHPTELPLTHKSFKDWSE